MHPAVMATQGFAFFLLDMMTTFNTSMDDKYGAASMLLSPSHTHHGVLETTA
jgi:hypothetical protein